MLDEKAQLTQESKHEHKRDSKTANVQVNKDDVEKEILQNQINAYIKTNYFLFNMLIYFALCIGQNAAVRKKILPLYINHLEKRENNALNKGKVADIPNSDDAPESSQEPEKITSNLVLDSIWENDTRYTLDMLRKKYASKKDDEHILEFISTLLIRSISRSISLTQSTKPGLTKSEQQRLRDLEKDLKNQAYQYIATLSLQPEDILKLIFITILRFTSVTNSITFFKAFRKYTLSRLQGFLSDNPALLRVAEHNHTIAWKKLSRSWLHEARQISAPVYLNIVWLWFVILGFTALVIKGSGLLDDPWSLQDIPSTLDETPAYLFKFLAAAWCVLLSLKLPAIWKYQHMGRAHLSSGSPDLERMTSQYTKMGISVAKEMQFSLGCQLKKIRGQKKYVCEFKLYTSPSPPSQSTTPTPKPPGIALTAKQPFADTITHYVPRSWATKFGQFSKRHPAAEIAESKHKTGDVIDLSYFFPFPVIYDPDPAKQVTNVAKIADFSLQEADYALVVLSDTLDLPESVPKKIDAFMKFPKLVGETNQIGIKKVKGEDDVYEVKILGEQGDYRLVGYARKIVQQDKTFLVYCFNECVKHAELPRAIARAKKRR